MLDIRAIRAPRCGSGGPTLLSMLNLRARNGSASRIMRLQQADRVRLRQKFEEETGIKVDELGGIVVDEVSFADCETLGHMDERLRELTGNIDLMCGGIPLLLCGDCHQKPPPAGTPWYRVMVQNAMDNGRLVSKGLTDAVTRGMTLLHMARRVELRRLMRVLNGEKAFVSLLTQLRNPNVEQPVSAELLRRLEQQQVTPADLEKDPGWRFAPVGVLSHLERDTINMHQMEAFAMQFSVPLIKWRLKIKDEAAGLSSDLLSKLYDDETNLWGYFVEGAPVMLTETLKSVRKLVNGSPGILDSLSFNDSSLSSSDASKVRKAYEQGGFQEVVLDGEPLAVNVRVGGRQSPKGSAPGTAPGSVLWHGIELDDLSRLVTSLTKDGSQIIPLLVSSNTEPAELGGMVAAQNNVAEKLYVYCFQYQFAFALTDFVSVQRKLEQSASHM